MYAETQELNGATVVNSQTQCWLYFYYLWGSHNNNYINLFAYCSINNLFISVFFSPYSPGSSIDFYVAFGGLALEVCVLLRGLQMDWASLEVMNAVCQVYIHLFLKIAMSFVYKKYGI